LWESRPLGVLTLRREADIQKLEANKRNKLKAKAILKGMIFMVKGQASPL
jgi:hypothetical protein